MVCSLNQILCVINPTTVMVVLIGWLTIAPEPKPLGLPCLMLLLECLVKFIPVLSIVCSS